VMGMQAEDRVVRGCVCLRIGLCVVGRGSGFVCLAENRVARGVSCAED
jgi:hypothetical protein